MVKPLVMVLACLFVGQRCLAQEPLLSWVKVWQDKPLIGSVGSTGYNLNFDFGIEQWESGKRSELRRQQWSLTCSHPATTGSGLTNCYLHRVVIDRWPHLPSATITNHSHSTKYGGLELTRADWEEGKLDFNVVHDEDDKTQVFIDMSYRCGSIYLESYKAFSTGRTALTDAVVTIELRIPDQTYSYSAPMEMKGLKSKLKQKWEATISDLSNQDQLSWQNLSAKGMPDFALTDRDVDAEMQRAFQSWDQVRSGERAPRADEQNLRNKLIAELFLQRVSAWLSATDLSREGQTAILDFFSKKAAGEPKQNWTKSE